MLPPSRKTPLLRRCDKIGLSAAIFVLILTVLGNATNAKATSGLSRSATLEKPQPERQSQALTVF